MAFKSWFGGGQKQPPTEYTIDDLIVLERYADAEEKLRAKLKLAPQDLHTHLKLAEVYTQLKQYGKAVDEFGFVAEEYAADGFYEKGIALLSKAMRLAPLDTSLRSKTERFQREKSMEHVRTLAIEGLRAAGGAGGGTSALELQRLWHNLATSRLVQNLPGDQLKRLLSHMQLAHFAARETLAEERSPEAFLLLLVRGEVEVRAATGPPGPDGRPGKEMTLRSFTSGDVLGEGVLLEHKPWPAKYRVAEEPLTALRLTREGLEQALQGNPDPRGFLEALREQHNDRDVTSALRRLQAPR